MLDWKDGSETIFRRIRAFSPAPGCHTFLPGRRRLKIISADPGNGDLTDKNAPGTIVSDGKDGFLVACGDGYLTVKELQLEGKKPMTSAKFLRGRPELIGQILGIRS